MTNAANLVIGVVGAEDDVAFSSEDADTDGGSGWTSLTRIDSSGPDDNIRGHAFKVTTTAVSQTYNPTMSGGGDPWTCSISSFESDAVPLVAGRPHVWKQQLARM